jgi:hypothetical protein
MLLLVAYDHFNSRFVNGFRAKTNGGAYMKKQGNRTVSIVRFGVFPIEEITMPAVIEDLTNEYLFAKYHPALEGSEGRTSLISSMFDSLL